MKPAACLLLMFLLPATSAHAAALDALAADGWFTWRVEAAAGATAWCCVDWSRGEAKQGCNLDDERNGYIDCERSVVDDASAGNRQAQVYAKIESGSVSRLRVLSPGCPVRTEDEMKDLGPVGTGETFDWLARLMREHESAEMRGQAAFVMAGIGADGSEKAIMRAMVDDPDRDVREEAVFALSQLPGERAVDALLAVVEDRRLGREPRKTALFWLVQSESDRAFETVERLLADDSAR